MLGKDPALAVPDQVAPVEPDPLAAAVAQEQGTPTAPAKPELSPAQCAARLAELFPALFATQGPAKPIKLRIQADIQARAPGVFSRKALSIVLHRHTTSTPYLKALVAAPTRFDLDGEPAGEIAEEHRQAAREEVERRRAIVAARRAAEAQARGPRPARPAHAPRNVQDQGNADAAGEAATTSGPASADGAPAQPRQERGPRPRREGQAKRGAGREGARDAGQRQGQLGRRGPDRPARPPQAQQPPRPAHHDLRSEAPRARPHPEGPLAAAPAALPEDPARRERALLLRTYEASSLTKANFCVLKRITEAELDAQLALARQERGPARPRP